MMNTQVKVNYTETVHTYAEWKQIENAKRKAKKEKTIYFAKQKIAGIIMMLIGIIMPFVLDGDATFSLIAIPMGLWLLFTKQKVMMFDGYEEQEEIGMKNVKHPCKGCIYYATCGESTRTMPCNGRKTKSEKKREEK